MRPRLFIGCSSEGIDHAYAIQEELEHKVDPVVWPQDVFTGTRFTIEGLMNALPEFDYAVFIFVPDDSIEIRGEVFDTVRDNVIFEFGLFLARLGRERCFFIVPEDKNNLRMPTNLWGMNPLTFKQDRSDKNLRAALGPACNQIRKAITKYGPIRQLTTVPNEPISRIITSDEKDSLENDLTRIISESVSENLPCILYVDIDRFTAINKWYGKEVCDEVLFMLKPLIKDIIKGEYLKRIGGDQFIVCLVNKTVAQATRIGNQIVDKIRKTDWACLSPNLFLTASIGVAQYKKKSTLSEWIVRGIHGSLNAKKSGGNRTTRGPLIIPNHVEINYLRYLS
jgi:diguanylate cyclase (GGDEF)-like protein